MSDNPPIYEVEGEDLKHLLEQVEAPTNDIRKISICLDGGVMIKVNEDTWTVPLGTLRP